MAGQGLLVPGTRDHQPFGTRTTFAAAVRPLSRSSKARAPSESGRTSAHASVPESPYSIADGRRAMGRILSAPQPPTAVICGNDVLAFGALFEAQGRGIDVPGSLSVTGFDDLELASQLDPPLTTMRVPTAEMGHRAAEYLLARLDNQPTQDRVALEVGLTVRGSTAPPRRRPRSVRA